MYRARNTVSACIVDEFHTASTETLARSTSVTSVDGEQGLRSVTLSTRLDTSASFIGFASESCELRLVRGTLKRIQGAQTGH